MKNGMHIFKITGQIALLICLIACGNESQKNQTTEWANTSWQQLEQENIKLRLPDQLERSSRYRIKEDLPALAQDSVQLRLVQNSLKVLEFEDAEIDVFIDTTKAYRMLIICNTAKIDFNKTDVAILKQQLKSNNDQSAANNPVLDFSEISVQMKRNSNHKLARYTTQIKNTLANNQVYNSVYYLTGDSYTLVVYEFSEDQESIEKYLWTTRIQ